MDAHHNGKAYSSDATMVAHHDDKTESARVEHTSPMTSQNVTTARAENELISNNSKPEHNREDDGRNETGPETGAEAEAEADEEEEEEAEAQEDTQNSVSIEPDWNQTVDDKQAPDERQLKAEHRQADTSGGHSVDYDEHSDSSESSDKMTNTNSSNNDQLSRRAHLLSNFGHKLGNGPISNELRKLRNQRAKLFAKGQSKRRRRRRKSKQGTNAPDDEKRQTGSSPVALIKSMQTRQGSTTSTTTSATMLANYGQRQPEPAASSSSALSNTIRQHLPSFQLSAAMQRLVMNKLGVQQQQQQPHALKSLDSQHQHLAGANRPLEFAFDYPASASSIAQELTPNRLIKQQQLQLDEHPRLAELISQWAAVTGDEPAASYPVAAKAARVPMMGSPTAANGGRMIPIEIIGLDPTVTSSILYGAPELSSSQRVPAGSELPSDSNQVFAANGPTDALASFDGRARPPAGESPSAGANPMEQEPERPDNRDPARPGQTGGRLKPSSVFHIHHFHHTQTKPAAASQQEATNGDEQQHQQPQLQPQQQQQQPQEDQNNQQTEQPGDLKQQQQVAVNEKGELVYLPIEHGGEPPATSGAETPDAKVGPHQAEKSVQPVVETQAVAGQAQQEVQAQEEAPSGAGADQRQPHQLQQVFVTPTSTRARPNELWQTVQPNEARMRSAGQNSSAPMPYYRNLRHQSQQARPAPAGSGPRRQRVYLTNLGQTISLVDSHEQQHEGQAGGGEPEEENKQNLLMVAYRPAPVGQAKPGDAAYDQQVEGHQTGPAADQLAGLSSHYQASPNTRNPYNEGSESKASQIVSTRHLSGKYLLRGANALASRFQPQPLHQHQHQLPMQGSEPNQANGPQFILTDDVQLSRPRPSAINFTDLALANVLPRNSSFNSIYAHNNYYQDHTNFSGVPSTPAPLLAPLLKVQTIPLISLNSSQVDQSYWPPNVGTNDDEEDRRILSQLNGYSSHSLAPTTMTSQFGAKSATNFVDNLALIKHLQQMNNRAHLHEQQALRATNNKPIGFKSGNATKMNNNELMALINELRLGQVNGSIINGASQPQQAANLNVSQLVDPATHSLLGQSQEVPKFELTLASDRSVPKIMRNQTTTLDIHQLRQKGSPSSSSVHDHGSTGGHLMKSTQPQPTTTGQGHKTNPPPSTDEFSDLTDSAGLSNIALAFIFIVSLLTLILIAASIIYRRRRACAPARSAHMSNETDPSGAGNRKSSGCLDTSQRAKHFARSNLVGQNEATSIKSLDRCANANLQAQADGHQGKKSVLEQVNELTNKTRTGGPSSRWAAAAHLGSVKLCTAGANTKQSMSTFSVHVQNPADKYQLTTDESVTSSGADIKTLNTRLQKASYLKSLIAPAVGLCNQANKKQQVSGTRRAELISGGGGIKGPRDGGSSVASYLNLVRQPRLQPATGSVPAATKTNTSKHFVSVNNSNKDQNARSVAKSPSTTLAPASSSSSSASASSSPTSSAPLSSAPALYNRSYKQSSNNSFKGLNRDRFSSQQPTKHYSSTFAVPTPAPADTAVNSAEKSNKLATYSTNSESHLIADNNSIRMSTIHSVGGAELGAGGETVTGTTSGQSASDTTSPNTRPPRGTKQVAPNNDTYGHNNSGARLPAHSGLHTAAKANGVVRSGRSSDLDHCLRPPDLSQTRRF